MRVWLILAGVVLVVAVVVVVTSGPSASDQVEAKVQELADAIGNRDYATICRDVLAPSLVAHLSSHGIDCTRALRVGLGRVRNPIVSVGKVVVKGRRASAVTLTVATGQQASLNAVLLVDTKRGWRITSLASPVSAFQLK
jgi:hypothetical protein